MQIFPRQLNLLPLALGAATLLGGTGLVLAVWIYAAPHNLQVGYAPEQPVPYSHRLHVQELGLDCRYCHANVERTGEAMVPPTQTCMGCHSQVRTDSAMLQPVRDSWETGEALEWVRVHQVPDHAFFDHSVHLAAGVGCVSCHGRIDEMEVVRIEEPLSMGWCLDCHRDPGPNLRPRSEITNMTWEPDEAWLAQIGDRVSSLEPPEHCSGCHR